MEKFINWMDSQTPLIKALFCIPFVAIIWVVYRIFKSYFAKDWLGLVLGVLLIFVGIPFLWLIDLIFIFYKGKVLWFDYSK